jgi:hypothetical protein
MISFFSQTDYSWFLFWQVLIPNLLEYAEYRGIPEQSAQKQHYCIVSMFS